MNENHVPSGNRPGVRIDIAALERDVGWLARRVLSLEQIVASLNQDSIATASYLQALVDKLTASADQNPDDAPVEPEPHQEPAPAAPASVPV